VGSKSKKLLASMRQSKAGRRRNDIVRLLTGFGFIMRAGKKYDIISHPDYPELCMNLTRSSGELATGWVATAVKLVDKLQELQIKGEEANGN